MTSIEMDIHQHLNIMFDHSTDLVFFMKKVNDDYIYQYINPSALNTIPNINVGERLSAVMDSKIAKTIQKYYDEAIKTKKQTTFQDYTMFTNDIRKYESTIYPIFIDDEALLLVITRLISFDRKIEDKYLFMRSVFFNTFLSTVLLSKDNQLLEANPAFLEDFGICIEEVRGKNLQELDLIEPEHESQYENYFSEAIRGEAIRSKHLQFKNPTGQSRHFISSFSPLTDDEDEVVAVFLILQETTEFLRQKQELKTVSHTMDILKRALSSTADISIADKNGRIIEVNDKFIERSGFDRKDLIGNTHNVLNSQFHPKEFFENLWKTISSGQIWRGEVCNKSKSGETYWNEATIIPLRDIDGNVYQYLGIYFNVSDKKKMMTELRAIERTFRLITENTNDLIVIFNQYGKITYASPSYVRLLGIDEENLIGMGYDEIVAFNSLSNWQKILKDHKQNEDVSELELLLPTGETIWTECQYKSSSVNRLEGTCETTMVSRIITERKNYENQLVFMAYHDGLTHLPNRRFLEKEFPHLVELANAQFKSIGIIYIDGDNFKKVNDAYGHDVGDVFIRNFGQVLARNVKVDDIVCRMGGDEFVIILTGLSRHEDKYLHEIDVFFKQIQKDLSKGWVIDCLTFKPTATMGVAIYPNHATKLDELIDIADQMLFKAKEESRNTYKIYNV